MHPGQWLRKFESDTQRVPSFLESNLVFFLKSSYLILLIKVLVRRITYPSDKSLYSYHYMISKKLFLLQRSRCKSDLLCENDKKNVLLSAFFTWKTQ